MLGASVRDVGVQRESETKIDNKRTIEENTQFSVHEIVSKLEVVWRYISIKKDLRKSTMRDWTPFLLVLLFLLYERH